jgi:hypothetical protein
MGLSAKQLNELVIRPALEAVELYSPAAAELVLGTACQESNLKYLHQLGAGPACGLWQMEPATHDDLWANFINARPKIREPLRGLSLIADPDEMVWNLLYAAAMCRVHYYRVKEKLPAVGNIRAQADYWKKYYNTALGAGTVEQYLENWRKFATT